MNMHIFMNTFGKCSIRRLTGEGRAAI